MLIAFHIIVAIVGLGVSTWLLVAPSRAKLRASYGLLAGTLASGAYLVATLHAHILQTCVTGLVYTGAVAVEVALARRKLALVTNR